MFLVGACGSVATADPSASADPRASGPGVTTLTIAQGTVGRVGALSIGVFSVRDVAGTLEAALGIEGEPGATVHVGDTIERAGYSIYVQEGSGRSDWFRDASGCDRLAGISYGIKVTAPKSRDELKGLCLLAFLTLEGWQSGRMRRS